MGARDDEGDGDGATRVDDAVAVDEEEDVRACVAGFGTADDDGGCDGALVTGLIGFAFGGAAARALVVLVVDDPEPWLLFVRCRPLPLPLPLPVEFTEDDDPAACCIAYGGWNVPGGPGVPPAARHSLGFGFGAAFGSCEPCRCGRRYGWKPWYCAPPPGPGGGVPVGNGLNWFGFGGPEK